MPEVSSEAVAPSPSVRSRMACTGSLLAALTSVVGAKLSGELQPLVHDVDGDDAGSHGLG